MSKRHEMLKNYSMVVLKHTLRYQSLTEIDGVDIITTMGNCMAECGMPARGAGVCKRCIEEEIYERERAGK